MLRPKALLARCHIPHRSCLRNLDWAALALKAEEEHQVHLHVRASQQLLALLSAQVREMRL